MRRAEEIGRGRDEEDLGAFAVDRRVHPDAGEFLDFAHGEIERVLEPVRLDPEMVAGAVAIGRGFHDPVDVAAHQVQQLARHHGDLRRIDAVGAVHRAAPALGALVEVVEPLLEHIHRQVAAAGQPAERASGGREVPAVDRAEQLGAQHRHVPGVAGAEIEVALVGAGAAAHADIHEQPEGAVFFQPLAHALEHDLPPVFGEFPVQVCGLPVPRVGQPQVLEVFGRARVRVRAFAEFGSGAGPRRARLRVVDLHQLVGVNRHVSPDPVGQTIVVRGPSCRGRQTT